MDQRRSSKHRPPPTPSTAAERRCCDLRQPSFSSSLLDAIYRSIDEPDPINGASGASARPRTPAAATQQRSRPPSVRRAPSSSSSSEAGSSYGSFSSSEVDTIAAARRPARQLRPIKTAVAASPPRPPRATSAAAASSDGERVKGAGAIRARMKELRKVGGTAPASPAARLAGFLNSIFASSGGRKQRRRGDGGGGESASSCSTASSSHQRSCLSKTPTSTAVAKRSVRFYPVSVIVGEDCQKQIAGDRVRRPAPERVEQLIREISAAAAAAAEEEEEGSDSSSDLFELESLAPIGGGGRYSNELPVYETTRVGGRRAGVHGVGVRVV